MFLSSSVSMTNFLLLVALACCLIASVDATARLRGSNAARSSSVSTCRSLKAALIWNDSVNDGSNYAVLSDMSHAFGDASSSGIQRYTQQTGYPTTLTELLQYDVIVVEGGGPAGEPVLSWLNDAGKNLLELAANAGVSIFVQAGLGGTSMLQVELPFGAHLTSVTTDTDKQQYAQIKQYPENPLNSAASPVAELYTGMDRFARSQVTDYENFGLQVLVQDAMYPSNAFVVGGSTAVGSRVLFSGASPTGAWAAVDATAAADTQDAYSALSPLVQTLRLNMMDYVCQGAVASAARQERR